MRHIFLDSWNEINPFATERITSNLIQNKSVPATLQEQFKLSIRVAKQDYVVTQESIFSKECKIPKQFQNSSLLSITL